MAQPSIPGTGVGIPRMPYGSDGSNWIALLVSALGRLQVDVISAALGSGAATEATLLLIKGYVDALETLLAGGLPAALDAGSLKVKEQSPLTGFATSANQTTMITALQLIDDLRNALGSVNTDDLQVDVKTSALPTDAATQTTLALCLTALQLIDDLRNALGTVATDKILVASKSGDKIFGFESVVRGTVSNLEIGAGDNELLSSAVPAGKIWVITAGISHDDITKISQVWIGLTDGAYSYWADTIIPSVIGDPARIRGPLVLQAGDKVRAYFRGCLAGDDIWLEYSGYQMNAP